MSANGPSVKLLNLEIENFKCFERLQLDFDRPSGLDGAWTCIAGINGAGKSSVLEAVCLLALDKNCALELGQTRLKSMERRPKNEAAATALSGAIQRSGADLLEYLRFDEHWRQTMGFATDFLVCAYGASRNLVPTFDNKNQSYGIQVRRVLSMFEPFAPFSNSGLFFRGQEEIPANFFPFFRRVIESLFPSELPLALKSDSFTFSIREATILPTELPDGYRSSLAWLSDLCWNWTKEHPQSTDPADTEALVLIDEIDLHLHPHLQRTIVPLLRKTFPKVQWIVTTHSPLVLSSFDKNEIILLDDQAEGGQQVVERQILGLSVDQIIQHLMGTAPSSGAMEAMLREAEEDPSKRPAAMAMMESPMGEEPLLSADDMQDFLSKLSK
jgi:hypothetical protein